MLKPGTMARVRMTVAAMVGGAMLAGGCGLGDIKASAIKGGLGAVEGAAKNLLDALLINFNEIFEATPDTKIDTP